MEKNIEDLKLELAELEIKQDGIAKQYFSALQEVKLNVLPNFLNLPKNTIISQLSVGYENSMTFEVAMVDNDGEELFGHDFTVYYKRGKASMNYGCLGSFDEDEINRIQLLQNMFNVASRLPEIGKLLSQQYYLINMYKANDDIYSQILEVKKLMREEVEKEKNLEVENFLNNNSNVKILDYTNSNEYKKVYLRTGDVVLCDTIKIIKQMPSGDFKININGYSSAKYVSKATMYNILSEYIRGMWGDWKQWRIKL